MAEKRKVVNEMVLTQKNGSETNKPQINEMGKIKVKDWPGDEIPRHILDPFERNPVVMHMKEEPIGVKSEIPRSPKLRKLYEGRRIENLKSGFELVDLLSKGAQIESNLEADEEMSRYPKVLETLHWCHDHCMYLDGQMDWNYVMRRLRDNSTLSSTERELELDEVKWLDASYPRLTSTIFISMASKPFGKKFTYTMPDDAEVVFDVPAEYWGLEGGTALVFDPSTIKLEAVSWITGAPRYRLSGTIAKCQEIPEGDPDWFGWCVMDENTGLLTRKDTRSDGPWHEYYDLARQQNGPYGFDGSGAFFGAAHRHIYFDGDWQHEFLIGIASGGSVVIKEPNAAAAELPDKLRKEEMLRNEK